MLKRFENCSMYRSGEFFGNYHRVLCRWVEVEIVKYAQYPAGLRVSYLEKGKRKARMFHLAYNPSLVIAKGHDSPEPDGMYGPAIDDGSGMIVRHGRYQSFDKNWRLDFERDVLPKCEVLANYHDHNPYYVPDLEPSAS